MLVDLLEPDNIGQSLAPPTVFSFGRENWRLKEILAPTNEVATLPVEFRGLVQGVPITVVLYYSCQTWISFHKISAMAF